MALSKYKLGELIELTTETNACHQFGANDVRGMTITKQIIPTKANVSTADLSKFLADSIPRNFYLTRELMGSI